MGNLNRPNDFLPSRVEFSKEPASLLLTSLAFPSVGVLTCFVPLIFLILCHQLAELTLETFLAFRAADVRQDCAPYDSASEATLATFSIVMRMVQVFCVCLVKFDCAFTVGASVCKLFLLLAPCLAYDFAPYDPASETTLRTLSIVMCVVQVFCIGSVKFDCAFAVGTRVRELFWCVLFLRVTLLEATEEHVTDR